MSTNDDASTTRRNRAPKRALQQTANGDDDAHADGDGAAKRARGQGHENGGADETAHKDHANSADASAAAATEAEAEAKADAPAVASTSAAAHAPMPMDEDEAAAWCDAHAAALPLASNAQPHETDATLPSRPAVGVALFKHSALAAASPASGLETRRAEESGDADDDAAPLAQPTRPTANDQTDLPNATDEALATAAVAAQLAIAANPPAAVQLYGDAVQSVLRFLPLWDVTRCVRVSRDWQRVVGRMQSLQAPFERTVSTAGCLLGLCSSAMARHIGSLTLDRHLGLGGHLLERIVRDMPQLAHLHCTIMQRDGTFEFPPRLTSLHLTIRFASLRGEQRVVNAIGRLTQLRQLRLIIDQRSYEYDGFSDSEDDDAGDQLFKPLVELPHLEDFSFDVKAHFGAPPGDLFLPPDIDCLRRMPSLTRLSLMRGGKYTDEPLRLLTQLTAEPHTLQLKEIDLHHCTLTDESLQALSRVPTLTRLASVGIFARRLAPLQHLQHLTLLDVMQGIDRVADEEEDEEEGDPQTTLLADDVVATVAPMASLTRLRLCVYELGSAHVVAIMRQHPQLEWLEASGMAGADGWACMAAAPWPSALQHLSLKGDEFRYEVTRTPKGTSCIFEQGEELAVPAFVAAVTVIPSLTSLTFRCRGLTEPHLAALFEHQPQLCTLRFGASMTAGVLLRAFADAPPTLRTLSWPASELFIDRTGRHLRLHAGQRIPEALLMSVLARYPNLVSLDLRLHRPESVQLLAERLAQCASLRLLQVSGFDAVHQLQLFATAPPQLMLMHLRGGYDAPNASILMRRTEVGGVAEHGSPLPADSEADPIAASVLPDTQVRMQLNTSKRESVSVDMVLDALVSHQHITVLELDSRSPTGGFISSLAQRFPSLRRLAFTAVEHEQTASELLKSVATSSPSLELIIHHRRRACVLVHLRPASTATGIIDPESPSRALRLDFKSTAASDELPAILHLLPHLSELDLSLALVTAEPLGALLRSSAGLRVLTLRHMGQLNTLACFSADPSPLPLTHLTLIQPRCMSSRELLRLPSALRSLTHLSMFGCFGDRLDQYTVAVHTPPSAVLPTLVKFLYDKHEKRGPMAVRPAEIADFHLRRELTLIAGPDLVWNVRAGDDAFADPDADATSAADDDDDDSDDDDDEGEVADSPVSTSGSDSDESDSEASADRYLRRHHRRERYQWDSDDEPRMMDDEAIEDDDDDSSSGSVADRSVAEPDDSSRDGSPAHSWDDEDLHDVADVPDGDVNRLAAVEAEDSSHRSDRSDSPHNEPDPDEADDGAALEGADDSTGFVDVDRRGDESADDEVEMEDAEGAAFSADEDEGALVQDAESERDADASSSMGNESV